MTISELIAQLTALKEQHGDRPVVMGYFSSQDGLYADIDHIEARDVGTDPSDWFTQRVKVKGPVFFLNPDPLEP